MTELVTCRNCKHNTLHEEDGEQYNWCEIDNDNYEVSEPRECAAYIAATNSDVLRAMSDEELADVFDHVQGDAFLVGVGERKNSVYPGAGVSWLDWLRQEVEE